MSPRDAAALYELVIENSNGQVQHRVWAEGPPSLLAELRAVICDGADQHHLAARLGERVVWTPGPALAELAQTVAALARADGNQRQAARTLDISYATLRRRVAEMGLTTWLRSAYPLSGRQPRRRASL